MEDSLRLTEAVCARLCHDLSGLLGSLVGTLELVTETSADKEAAAVASAAAAALALRLRLLRAAWGGRSEPLDLPRLTTLAQGLAARRVALDVSGLPPTTVFSPEVGCLVLNLLLLAAESLPRGGVLRLDGGAGDLVARLNGPSAAWPAGLVAMLADSEEAWLGVTEPRTVQAPLTALLARHHGLRLAVLLTAGQASAAPPLRLTAG